MSKRFKTDKTGVYYRISKRVGGSGDEKVYYVAFKKNGKVTEAKAGRQYADGMTPARAALYRAALIEGREQTPQEKREADKAAKQAEQDKWTIARLWKSYKENKTTYKGIVTDQNRFDLYLSEPFGKKEPADLLPLDVDRLRINMLKKKKPATVRNTLELLRRVVNYGVNKRLCEPLHFRIELPKVNNVKTEDLSPNQLTALLAAIEEDTHPQAGAMMKMALFTGMRRGELFRLKWQDINKESGFINISDPKGGIDERIPLNQTARDLLQNHPRTRSPYVFPGRGGEQRTDIIKPMRRICKAAGLPKGFRPLHGLRHVYASMLASSGQVDLYTLQRLLTHKSPVMTMRYAHLRDDALKAGADQVDVIFKKQADDRKEAANG
ncbi:MAG: site-specific integrase [Desulfotignum sp.]|nr:site-specific integrase [Desulfotignum sp.]